MLRNMVKMDLMKQLLNRADAHWVNHRGIISVWLIDDGDEETSDYPTITIEDFDEDRFLVCINPMFDVVGVYNDIVTEFYNRFGKKHLCEDLMEIIDFVKKWNEYEF